MTDWLDVLNHKHPVRFKAEEKQAFMTAFLATAAKLGWSAKVGTLQKKQTAKNLIVGDPSTARVLITAAYDTPARGLLPDLRLPRNWWAAGLYLAAQALVLFLLALTGALLLQKLVGTPAGYFAVWFLCLYFGLLLLTSRAFANPHNRNASSGTAAILTLMETLPEEDRSKVAFLLFDRSARGGKAWGTAHADIAWRTLTLSLDAVAEGDVLICTRQKAAGALEEYALFEDVLRGEGVHFYSHSAVVHPDHAQLPCSVHLLACHDVPLIGPMTGRLATARDVAGDMNTLCRTTDRLARLIHLL